MSIIRVKITPKIAITPHIASIPKNGLIGQNGNQHLVIIIGTSKKSSRPHKLVYQLDDIIFEIQLRQYVNHTFYYSVLDDKYAPSPIIRTATTTNVTHITAGVAMFNLNSIIKGNNDARMMKIIKPIARHGYAKFIVQPVHLTRFGTTRRGSFLQ